MKELTKEQEELAKGMLPMSNDIGHTFTPEMFNSLPEELRPVFTIKKMNNGSIAEVKARLVMEQQQDNKNKGITKLKKQAEQEQEYVANIVWQHLITWKNLINISTKEEINYNGTREVFDLLPQSVVLALFSEMITITGFMPRG